MDLVYLNKQLTQKLDCFLNESDRNFALNLPSSSTRTASVNLPDSFATVTRRNARSAPQRHLPMTASPSLMNRFDMLGLMSEMAQKDEKLRNAVIVNLPESGKNDLETDEIDSEIVSEIFHKAQLPKDDLLKVSRHGRKRQHKPRVLKVYTASEKTRNDFLAVFYKHKPIAGPSSFCRRDLTVTELKIDGQARREAFEENRKAGVRQSTVRDLQLVELPKPHHPFRPITAHPPSKNHLENSLIEMVANTDLLEDNSQRPKASLLQPPTIIIKNHRLSVYGAQPGLTSPYGSQNVNKERRKKTY
jgi:hypothetical protein